MTVVGFPPTTEEPWVTKRELAAIMRVSERTITTWANLPENPMPSDKWSERIRVYQPSRCIAWARARGAERKAA